MRCRTICCLIRFRHSRLKKTNLPRHPWNRECIFLSRETNHCNQQRRRHKMVMHNTLRVFIGNKTTQHTSWCMSLAVGVQAHCWLHRRDFGLCTPTVRCITRLCGHGPQWLAVGVHAHRLHINNGCDFRKYNRQLLMGCTVWFVPHTLYRAVRDD